MKQRTKYVAFGLTAVLGLAGALLSGRQTAEPVSPTNNGAEARVSVTTDVDRPAVPLAPAARPAKQTQVDRVYEVESAVARARAQGAGDNEVYRLRASGLSAREIAVIDERERADAEWRRRVDAWKAASERLQHDPVAVQALRNQLFTPQEQVWLDASIPVDTPQLKFE